MPFSTNCFRFLEYDGQCGRSALVAVGRGCDGDQSELELLTITQLCGESSDSCSGIHALVESGPIQLGDRGFAFSYMTSMTDPL